MSSQPRTLSAPVTPSKPRPSLWAGLALTTCIAALAYSLANLEAVRSLGLSPLTFAIILGMVAGNTFFPKIAPLTHTGVDFCKNRFLRAGIVLFGFRLTFQDAAAVGVSGLVLDAAIILAVFSLAMLVGHRILKMDRQTCMLVGAGSAICGAAAVMAMEPVARAQAHKVSVAVATVVVFGSISMFLYPLLYPLLGFSEHHFGIFIGSTVHEVAQVVAAGDAVSAEAANSAVITKMLRVMMLAPFLILVAWWAQRRGWLGDTADGRKAPSAVPWFAVGFVLVVALNSTGWIPVEVARILVEVSTLLLVTAMAALGLRTHASAIRQAGLAPLALAGILFLFLLVGGWGMNLLAVALA